VLTTWAVTFGQVDSESGIANLVDYSFLKRSEDKQSVSMHRLVQEIAQYQLLAAEKAGWLQRGLQMLDDFCIGNPADVNTWAPIYTPARPHLSGILPAADDAGIAEPTARLMNEYGLHPKARADFAAAEPLLRRPLAIDETSYGSNHLAVARDLNNFAELLRVTNRHSEAESLSCRSVEILLQFQQQTGHEHPDFNVILGWYRIILESPGLDAAATQSRRSRVCGWLYKRYLDTSNNHP